MADDPFQHDSRVIVRTKRWYKKHGQDVAKERYLKLRRPRRDSAQPGKQDHQIEAWVLHFMLKDDGVLTKRHPWMRDGWTVVPKWQRLSEDTDEPEARRTLLSWSFVIAGQPWRFSAIQVIGSAYYIRKAHQENRTTEGLFYWHCFAGPPGRVAMMKPVKNGDKSHDALAGWFFFPSLAEGIAQAERECREYATARAA